MNSGSVLAAPMMENMARNILHPVSGPRRSNAGLKGWSAGHHIMCIMVCVSPVGHVGLAPEYEEHVDAACPGAHRPPVLLHPYPNQFRGEILTHR